MELETNDIKKIAKLARLAITNDEIEIYKKELSSILKMVGELDEVDTSNIEPMCSVVKENHILREDKVIQENNVNEILLNAPGKNEDLPYFIVPKVIE